MPLLSTVGQSLAINAVLGGTSHTGLATASPGTTGANENAATGGYARQATSWSASSAGSAGTNTGALTFSTAGTVPVTHAQGWSALTAGNPTLGFTLASSVTAATITVAAGGLSATAS